MTNEEIIKKIEEYNTNEKKTIALFCDVFYPSIDGVISVVNNLAIVLSEHYNVVVCVPKHKKETVFRKEYLVIGAKSFKVPGMNYECSLNPAKDKEFMKYLSMLKIDLIHFHSPFFMGKFAAKYAKKNNIPLVATIHSKYKQDFWMSTHSHILTNILTRNIVKVFNKADQIITMNKYCEKTFRAYKVTPPITLIGNGTNYRAPEVINTATIRAELGIKSQNMLLFVGRLVKVKNLPLTLKIMSILKQKGIDFCFVCAGEGSQLKKLKRLSKKYNIENNVIFLGKIASIEKLSQIYASADLFVFNSTYDTEGLVILEAAATGTPSVVVENSGPACRIVNNENGFTSSNNPNEFANRIEELLKNKELIAATGEKAKQTLPKSWKDTCKDYVKFYNKLLKEPN